MRFYVVRPFRHGEEYLKPRSYVDMSYEEARPHILRRKLRKSMQVSDLIECAKPDCSNQFKKKGRTKYCVDHRRNNQNKKRKKSNVELA